MTTLFVAVFSVLLVERGVELILAERNRRWALRRGGREFGGWHYPLIVGMHGLFYFSLLSEWWMRSRTLNRWWPLWLGLLVAAQLTRVWVIASLGRFWNTRIIVLPGLEQVDTGPYRHVRHPNYLVVIVELLVVPLLFRAWITAAVFTPLNLLLLRIRIREEEAALNWAAPGRTGLRPRFIPRLSRTGRPPGVDRGSRSG
jgi:methyltransferase